MSPLPGVEACRNSSPRPDCSKLLGAFGCQGSLSPLSPECHRSSPGTFRWKNAACRACHPLSPACHPFCDSRFCGPVEPMELWTRELLGAFGCQGQPADSSPRILQIAETGLPTEPMELLGKGAFGCFWVPGQPAELVTLVTDVTARNRALTRRGLPRSVSPRDTNFRNLPSWATHGLSILPREANYHRGRNSSRRGRKSDFALPPRSEFRLCSKLPILPEKPITGPSPGHHRGITAPSPETVRRRRRRRRRRLFLFWGGRGASQLPGCETVRRRRLFCFGAGGGPVSFRAVKLFVVVAVVAVAVCFCFGAGGGPVSFGVWCETVCRRRRLFLF